MRCILILASLLPTALALSLPIVQSRDSPLSLPFGVQYNATQLAKIVEVDRARALSLIEAALEKIERILEGDASSSVPATNAAVSYVASVGVGNPATDYSLLIDTGSSNTWIGAKKPYVRTATSFQTANTVNVSYGSGSFFGREYIDQVTLGEDLVIYRQSIGVASTSQGINTDGILGVGPVNLTNGTLSPETRAVVPTVTDNLVKQGNIRRNVLGISFGPTNSTNDKNGELTFGGVDPNKYTGEITYAPITAQSPAKDYWGIDQSITFDGTTILSTTAGIVDTGTTLTLIASDAFAVYKAKTGGVLDQATGLLVVSPSQFANLKSLFFNINGASFELTANAQAWPRSLNTLIGGSPDKIYLIVADIGLPSGQGFDFINGQTFLERFYSVYDADMHRVGIATTPFTHATSN